MWILFVGAGTVGGYFGGRLIQAGRDVTFLVRPARAEILRRDGLRILSPHGDALLQPKLVLTGEIDGTYDLVILGVKGYALDDAIRDMATAVGPATTVLPLLNGMRHIDRLDETFSAQAVIGGVALVATQIDAEGRIVQLADVQQLRYGERDGQTTPRIRAINADLQGAGFDAGLSSSIVQDLWDKWVMLASLGAVTCLFRGPIGAVAAVPGGGGARPRHPRRMCGHRHGLWSPSLGRVPGPAGRDPHGRRVIDDVVDVPRHAAERAGRGRCHSGRPPRSRPAA